MIGEKLKEIRAERKLTQEEASKMIGIKQGTYAGWESDKHDPNIKMLKKIADIFKVSTDYLLGRIK